MIEFKVEPKIQQIDYLLLLELGPFEIEYRDGWQTWETEIRDMVDRDERHGNVVFGDPSQI